MYRYISYILSACFVRVKYLLLTFVTDVTDIYIVCMEDIKNVWECWKVQNISCISYITFGYPAKTMGYVVTDTVDCN